MEKFKELGADYYNLFNKTNVQSEEELKRWNSIVDQFKKNNKYSGVGGDHMGKILLEMDEFNLGLKSLKEVIKNGLNGVN